MIKDLVQLAAKLEAVAGTAETLAGADAFLVSNPSFKPNTPPNKRNLVSSSLSQFASIPGARFATIEFDVELKGSGVAGTAPEWGKLLKGCKMGETVVVSPASVTYLPISTDGSTLTMALYMDGKAYKIWGARGDVSLKLKTGAPGILHFIFTGADFSVTDVALLTSGVAYDSVNPPIFANASFGIGGYSPSMNALLENVEIKLGNKMQLRTAVNKASGYLTCQITGREAAMTFDPEEVLAATYDFYGILRAGTESALSTVLGSVAGNIATITAPKVQYIGINPADRGGITTLGIDCQLNRSSGDDELSIALT